MSSGILVREEPRTDFADYAQISISFQVVSELRYDFSASDPIATESEVPVARPYEKDYDTLPNAHPITWPRRFDTSGWGVLMAWRGDERVGGAVVAHGSDGIDMLEGRSDLAVLWDIRVAVGSRGCGVGTELVAAAERWSRDRGCSELKVETQNVNVGASRFYRSKGFRLRDIDPEAYPDLPGEIQLLFYTDLS